MLEMILVINFLYEVNDFTDIINFEYEEKHSNSLPFKDKKWPCNVNLRGGRPYKFPFLSFINMYN